MKNRWLSNSLILLLMLVLVSCAGESLEFEPGVTDLDLSATAESGLTVQERVEEGATAMPMPITGEEMIAGETDVVVQAPDTGEQSIEQPTGEPVAEADADDDGGETVNAGADMSKIDLSSKEGRIAFAQQDLAHELEVGVGAVEFVTYENRIWPDGHLGCPRKDIRYTPVEVPGYLIILKAGEKEYYYHGAAGKIPFHCREQKIGSGSGREIIVPPPDTGS